MVKIIVGISGSTGAIYGIRMLEALKAAGVETHLIISQWAETTIALETDYSLSSVKELASKVYSPSNQAALIASGSFRTDGMIIAPCSMKTLASISHGMADNLMARAADVVLKEGRKLLLLPRETPLSAIHLENMLKLARIGVAILPPMPAFYNHPETIDDIIYHTISRALDQFGLDNQLTPRWMQKKQNDPPQ